MNAGTIVSAAAACVVLIAAAAACGGSSGAIAGAAEQGQETSPALVTAPAASVVAPTAAALEACADLACTGLYADWDAKIVDPSNRDYAPAEALWADGAQKSRWIHLPAGTKIDTSDPDSWVFPVGTKLWKEFRLQGKRVETRMLSKGEAGWTFATYRWNDDGSAAPLLVGGEKNVFGTPYEVPALSECPECHDGRNDEVMGFELVGLGLPGATGLTLAELAQEGLLSDPPPSAHLAAPEDATGKAAAALTWLHANCGNACHNANPSAMASFTGLRMKLTAAQLGGAGGGVTATDTFRTAVGVASKNEHPMGEDWVRIVPGDSTHSLLPRFDATRGADADGFLQMPLLGTHVVDEEGVARVRGWIDAMGGE